MIRFLCVKIIGTSVKKFGCNEHHLTTRVSLHLFAHCKRAGPSEIQLPPPPHTHTKKNLIDVRVLKNKTINKNCIPVGCIPPARSPYLPACTAPGWWSPCQGGSALPGGGGRWVCLAGESLLARGGGYPSMH